ncbi:MAG: hypothetical protein ABW174_13275 [Flavitalea sp.]
MQLTEVKDTKSRQDFLMVNVDINSASSEYIRPLDKDINTVFDPAQNKAFRHGECTRWVLYSDEGKRIGRVAAFLNKKYKTVGDQVVVGGMGFFDCINDQKAADLLFDVAKHWLLQRGAGAMDGPINFGERDRWWGLVVDGFISPMYCMNFNLPYYQQLYENYGFRLFFNQECFGMKVQQRVQDKLYERHAVIAADPDFKAIHVRKNQLDKFAADFTTIYNKAWAGHGGMKQMQLPVVKKMFASMKPIMDEEIVWFTYYKDEPIAMWINLPDLNQWFGELNGKFGLLSKLKFLWVKATKKCTRFTGIAFGVVPEFQGKGVDSFMIIEGAKLIQPKAAYEDYEMQWIGDFNPRMTNIAKSLGTHITRRLITYRYNFDQTAEFHRHPIL